MSHGIKNVGGRSKRLESLYAIIHDDLDEVEAILRGKLHSDHPFVDRLAQHGFRLGGKRLRPALLLLTGKACGKLRPEHPITAAAVELVHMATLVHDDVLDEATLRRHTATVNARWDNEASVLLGDYLFTLSICLVSSLESNFACRAIGRATRVMCEGEMEQVGSRGNYDLSEDGYLNIIAGKTAELFACCCSLGAHYAGAEVQVQKSMAQFGRQLGIAFQITDDMLDLLGDEAMAGKSLGTDLAKQKSTLPLIRLLDQAGPEERTEIVAALSENTKPHRQLLRPWLERSDAIDYARQRARWFTESAKTELEHIPRTPARDALGHIADFVVNRDR
jgi:octaprenyl-diphosphate synthase